MYDTYKDKKKRAKYLQEYRRKNRDKIYQKRKEWIKKTGKKYNYYQPKNNYIDDLAGTSGIGRRYEKIALSILKGSRDCNDKNFSGKWDIEWNGLRIDVKMRNLNKYGFWGFTTKKNPLADYYLLFCVINNNIERIFLIPNDVFGLNLSISKNTQKFNQYLIDFHQTNVNQK